MTDQEEEQFAAEVVRRLGVEMALQLADKVEPNRRLLRAVITSLLCSRTQHQTTIRRLEIRVDELERELAELKEPSHD